MVGRLVSSKHLFRAVIRHDTQINETRRLVALMCARACVWSYCRWRTTLRNCVLCGPLTGADARSDRNFIYYRASNYANGRTSLKPVYCVGNICLSCAMIRNALEYR